MNSCTSDYVHVIEPEELGGSHTISTSFETDDSEKVNLSLKTPRKINLKDCSYSLQHLSDRLKPRRKKRVRPELAPDATGDCALVAEDLFQGLKVNMICQNTGSFNKLRHEFSVYFAMP